MILVSSVSYVGCFLEKFLGARRGLRLAGIVGGLASTTAANAVIKTVIAFYAGASSFTRTVAAGFAAMAAAGIALWLLPRAL